MKILINLISLVLPAIFWYLVCSFISWDTDLSHWNPVVRFAYLIPLFYASFKLLENKD